MLHTKQNSDGLTCQPQVVSMRGLACSVVGQVRRNGTVAGHERGGGQRNLAVNAYVLRSDGGSRRRPERRHGIAPA